LVEILVSRDIKSGRKNFLPPMLLPREGERLSVQRFKDWESESLYRRLMRSAETTTTLSG